MYYSVHKCTEMNKCKHVSRIMDKIYIFLIIAVIRYLCSCKRKALTITELFLGRLTRLHSLNRTRYPQLSHVMSYMHCI